MAQPPTSPRQYYPASTHSNSNGSMPQSTSPSLPLEDGSPSHRAQIKSDQDVPIDPTIAASSPTYPAQGGPYSGYPPQHDMSHGYPQHPGGPMYTQPRPDWGGYSQHPQHMPPPYPAAGVSNSSVPPGGARSQVCISYHKITRFATRQRIREGHQSGSIRGHTT